MKNFTNYNDFSKKEDLKFDSKVVHGALGNDPITGSVSFPIFQSATFRHRGLGNSTGFDYSRVQNPTRQELERTMAILEEGHEGFAVASGMAATTMVLSLLNPGDHIILSDDLYGGTYRAVREVLRKYGIEDTSVDLSYIDKFKEAIKPNTKMVFIETPSNPVMKVADIEEIAKIAKKNGMLTVVDNTFLTPYLQKPLTIGADITISSSTKYLAGHNDTVSGIVVTKTEELSEKMRTQMKINGAGLASLDAWLVLRGLKTLAIRMDRHNENTKKVAEWLRKQPKIKKVYYVGFEDHKDYKTTLKQTTGFGGMISFNVDSAETAKQVLERIDLIMFAESLGGVESLMTYPMTQTHTEIPEDIRNELGITNTFLRLSVGIENVDDIINDLDKALNG